MTEPMGLSGVRCSTADNYRTLATRIREVAHETQLSFAKRELIRLANRYDQRAEHLDLYRRPSGEVSLPPTVMQPVLAGIPPPDGISTPPQPTAASPKR